MLWHSFLCDNYPNPIICHTSEGKLSASTLEYIYIRTQVTLEDNSKSYLTHMADPAQRYPTFQSSLFYLKKVVHGLYRNTILICNCFVASGRYPHKVLRKLLTFQLIADPLCVIC